jgi:apolipoprotein N-acyltransferase
VLIASIWFLPTPPPALAVSFVPLLTVRLRAGRSMEVLVTGMLAQWVASAIQFSWILTAAPGWYQLDMGSTTGAWLALTSLTNLHMPAVGLIWWWMQRRHGLPPAAASVLLATGWMSLARFHPTFVPFDYGYPWLWSGPPALHLAGWVGFRGLAWVALFVNAVLAFAWCAGSRRHALRLVCVAAGMLAASQIVGLVHGGTWSAGDRELRVSVVQPAFPRPAREEREAPANASSLVLRARQLLRLSMETHAHTHEDIWIWPESALRSGFGGRIGETYEAWIAREIAAPGAYPCSLARYTATTQHPSTMSRPCTAGAATSSASIERIVSLRS